MKWYYVTVFLLSLTQGFLLATNYILASRIDALEKRKPTLHITVYVGEKDDPVWHFNGPLAQFMEGDP